MIIFDIETNGLLEREDLRFHVGVTKDLITGESKVWYDAKELAEYLERSGSLVGHNICGYDIPVLERLTGVRLIHKNASYYDTLIASRMTFHQQQMLARSSMIRNHLGKTEEEREVKFPKAHLSRHTLESWGYRLQFPKIHFKEFETLTDEMVEYCKNDVALNEAIFPRLQSHGWKKGIPPQGWNAVNTQSLCHYYLTMQEIHGVGFDRKGAEDLYLKLLEEREKLTKKLQAEVGPFVVPKGKLVHPKRNRKPTGHVAGAAYQNVEVVEFNPASAAQVANRLSKVYGWKPDPEEISRTGHPHVTEEVLSKLDYPPIPDLLRFTHIKKLMGQLADGDKGWLKHEKDGRLHGRVNVIGTRTHRCSHSSPNLGQVPRVGSLYGEECRSLFRPTNPRHVMVGADATSLEMRCFGHFLSNFGPHSRRWVKDVILSGNVHRDWMEKTQIQSYDNQKTWTYAMLYGAGYYKLGRIIVKDQLDSGRDLIRPDLPTEGIAFLGKKSKQRVMYGVPGMREMYNWLADLVERKFYETVDGSIIEITSEHNAMNDVCQNLGAIIMKWALVCFMEMDPPIELLLNVHDEWQVECHPAVAEEVGEMQVDAMAKAGEILELNVPITGEYKVGATWAGTH